MTKKLMMLLGAAVMMTPQGVFALSGTANKQRAQRAAAAQTLAEDAAMDGAAATPSRWERTKDATGGFFNSAGKWIKNNKKKTAGISIAALVALLSALSTKGRWGYGDKATGFELTHGFRGKAGRALSYPWLRRNVHAADATQSTLSYRSPRPGLASVYGRRPAILGGRGMW